MTSNTTPGMRSPLSAHSESHQRAGEGGGPFDFMAKVPSSTIPPHATPDASAARPASTVCNNFYLLFCILTYILITLGSITGLSHQQVPQEPEQLSAETMPVRTSLIFAYPYC